MKTLKKLSNRKLDKLQDRLSDKYWRALDTAPFPSNYQIISAADKMLLRIAGERLRRLGL